MLLTSVDASSVSIKGLKVGKGIYDASVSFGIALKRSKSTGKEKSEDEAEDQGLFVPEDNKPLEENEPGAGGEEDINKSLDNIDELLFRPDYIRIGDKMINIVDYFGSSK